MRIPGKLMRVVAALGLGLTVMIAMPGSASATLYHSPPWVDLDCSIFNGPDMDGADLRPACWDSAPVLRGAGYTVFADIGVSSSTMMSRYYAQSDAIWALFGHSNAGFMTTYSPTTGQTVLRARWGMNGSCDGNDDCISDYTSTQLHAIKLMIFGGCHTALPWHNLTNDYRLPYHAVHYKGVDSAVGWSDYVYRPQMTTWPVKFFQYVGQDGKSATFFNAAIWAEEQTAAENDGDYGGVQSSVWYGNWNATVRPAVYGS